ncbi:hypothetical protein R75461_07239 [Paraburkholderia nemoris]|nr:hypothetical protein R75461_07239 [Paraburkholderia nemoris]
MTLPASVVSPVRRQGMAVKGPRIEVGGQVVHSAHHLAALLAAATLGLYDGAAVDAAAAEQVASICW